MGFDEVRSNLRLKQVCCYFGWLTLEEARLSEGGPYLGSERLSDRLCTDRLFSPYSQRLAMHRYHHDHDEGIVY